VDHVTLCVEGLGLLLSEPVAFWEGIPKAQE
jgi:hypothetical protein